MKLKRIENKRIETETEYELPVYLYYQDDDSLYDEYVKITEKGSIRIIQSHDKFEIIQNYHENYVTNDITRDITSEDNFNNAYVKHILYTVSNNNLLKHLVTGILDSLPDEERDEILKKYKK